MTDRPSSRLCTFLKDRAGKAARLSVAVLLATASAAAAQETGHVEANGLTLYHEVSGEGPPIVVLHGAYMNIPAMGEVIAALSDTRTVHAVEFQGHGRTADIDRPITYQNLADDVAAYMEAVGLPSADVFGYSMGATTGLQLAIRHPDKVDRLVAITASFDAEGLHPTFREFLPMMEVEMFLGLPMAEDYRALAPDPDGFPELVRKLIALEHEPMAWRAEVDALELPVLLVTGDADVVSLSHTLEMFELLGGGVMGDMGAPLPASRLAVLPGTSHTALIAQTELLMAITEPFLADEFPAGAFGN